MIKKLCIISLLCISNSTFSKIPLCRNSIAESWNNAKKIHSEWWNVVYSPIKVCRLNNNSHIKYDVTDLLNSASSNNSGAVIAFGNASPQVHNYGVSSVTLDSNLNLSNISLTAPPYYLQKEANNKNYPNGNEGIFRFYTQVFNSSCEKDPLGYKWIREKWQDSFFSQLKINGSNIVSSNTGQSFAKATNVILNNNGSEIKADVEFIEGLKHQTDNWKKKFLNFDDMCSMDVYVKFQLKPNQSPNFKRSGNYNLKFTK
ncbi:hypothetical protein QJU89_02910 [Pasteurella skyensis]|uniref:Uncharacterized protein n=1 Tax=Phocoenobacter skyensis TaxID=97481 RepID=A0AAJ6N8Z8_9PAST|nr:hypothetical protein [Pasteurella skyensis]MDP8162276.1 hypothetical protein [Pasteurella skyensis]MDP8172390.1 hypothetical protein [Pasteurella skyensis]MDP8178645.1 hypothetical protein [Pasteurella skyensis]MDP8182647.1 hypothetical protein [Pasteurella skyensis]MDP8188952.1 hypothetical protein [Pasteurella skyensis]